MGKKNLKKDGHTVSPVISVLLMAAITVTLAGIVGSMAYGMGGSIPQMNLVVVTAEQTNSTAIDFTFMGGPGTGSLRYLNATIDGNPADPLSDYQPDVGSVWTYVGSGSFPRNHVVVAATFDDGSDQVVLDTYI
ncbi:MAG: type IV pilin N-terminal domain-containing protein [Candidatus Syntrophoarchaeum sp.]|nr:type IV pilin N-terminal domain-containing protein [Candidatus Syntrophoarchaeum sp.]